MDPAPTIIACETLRDEFARVAPDHEIEYCEGLLHDYPDRLRETVQRRIDAVAGARTILLGYGRCSNGLTGLRAGPHRLVLPAVDDCISLLLGSRSLYLEQFSAQPGTYYYTRGWIEYIDDPYHEYLEMVPRYGEEKAREIAHLILAHYTRVAVIDTGTYPLEEYDDYLRTVSEFYGLPLEVLPGSLRLLERLVDGPHDAEFIVVEPGGVLEERRFWDLSAEAAAGAAPAGGSPGCGSPEH